MRIEIKYSASQGPHPVELDQNDISRLKRSGSLTTKQSTPKGDKTITITGSKQELLDLAEALTEAAKNMQ
ncbi:MAG: hypothetical protein JJU35_12430 [Balneolales bacterium]|nr:hypothetical protein [Balneolales bacterium]